MIYVYILYSKCNKKIEYNGALEITRILEIVIF